MIEHQDLVNEVLQKVGRNLLLYQQLEQLLKYLVARGELEGKVSELENIFSKKQEVVDKQTLGTLIGLFIDNTSGSEPEESATSEEVEESYFAIRFSLNLDSQEYLSRKASLARLVEQRNILAHHFAANFDGRCPKDCRRKAQELDEQSEVIREEIKYFRNLVTRFIDGYKRICEYYCSEHFEKDLKMEELRQSQISKYLGIILSEVAREDGWLPVSTAGHILKRDFPDEFNKLKEEYGFKSLTQFVEFMDVFELKNEKTAKGGDRLVYKLSDGWELN
ncbi:OST-HTH/LOTUS domain-containing protein [Pseudoalteromonas sp. GB56]